LCCDFLNFSYIKFYIRTKFALNLILLIFFHLFVILSMLVFLFLSLFVIRRLIIRLIFQIVAFLFLVFHFGCFSGFAVDVVIRFVTLFGFIGSLILFGFILVLNRISYFVCLFFFFFFCLIFYLFIYFLLFFNGIVFFFIKILIYLIPSYI
jgi:hypothetical protein